MLQLKELLRPSSDTDTANTVVAKANDTNHQDNTVGEAGVQGSQSWINVKPLLLRECNVLLLVQMYTDQMELSESNSSSTMDIDVIQNTVLKMIDQLAQSKVVDSQHLVDVVPLALLPLQGVVKSLLNVLATKIRDSALLDVRLINALTHIVKYAKKDYLNASDVLTSLDVIAVKLSSSKFQESSSLGQYLLAMTGLVDAAMMLNVRNLNEAKLRVFRNA